MNDPRTSFCSHQSPRLPTPGPLGSSAGVEGDSAAARELQLTMDSTASALLLLRNSLLDAARASTATEFVQKTSAIARRLGTVNTDIAAYRRTAAGLESSFRRRGYHPSLWPDIPRQIALLADGADQLRLEINAVSPRELEPDPVLDVVIAGRSESDETLRLLAASTHRLISAFAQIRAGVRDVSVVASFVSPRRRIAIAVYVEGTQEEGFQLACRATNAKGTFFSTPVEDLTPRLALNVLGQIAFHLRG